MHARTQVFLKRRLSAVQYLALVTLACGTACSQVDEHAPHARPHCASSCAWHVRGMHPPRVTLACGTACSQLPSGGGGKHGHAGKPLGAQASAPIVGAGLSVLSSLLSALGGA